MVERGHGLGPTTDVTVRVTGSFILPLHLQALETLEDPILQSEIMQEAVRIAIAEKLAGFHNLNITTTHKGGKPVCEATLQLADLCSAIADVQCAYRHAVAQMVQMQEMITVALQQEKDTKKEEGKGSEKACEMLAKLAKKLEETLDGPGESSLSEAIRTRMQNNNDDDDNSNDDLAEGSYDEYRDPEDEGYMPLMDNNQSESDNENNDEGD
ncbi:hypothetical protein LSM04_004018 [Trypanosoma melophagium]|uniref:uncharacterized protein n=1 Tax=Trypanosoma melophagium TaxID=715481 RepID=UPI00351A118E|nr:hypothetical protein LSM04_004018 [Trypanosoma melophagium]